MVIVVPRVGRREGGVYDLGSKAAVGGVGGFIVGAVGIYYAGSFVGDVVEVAGEQGRGRKGWCREDIRDHVAVVGRTAFIGECMCP